MKSNVRLWLLALLLTLGLVACGTTTDEPEAPADDQGTDVVEEEAGGEFPRTITDSLGNEVTIEEEPERVVSLIPSITETLFAIDKGDTVVGRTDFDNYPEEVEDIQSVGGMEFDVEQVLALEPDLVLSHGSGAHSSEGGLNQLREAGVTVVVVHDASSIDEVYDSIAMIGEATGADEQAATVISDMKEGFAALAEKAEAITDEERANVWVEVSPEPEIYTTGKGTFLDEMLTLINADNAAGDVEGWVQFSEEEAVAFQPDVIITTYGYYVEDPEKQVMARDGWQSVPAVENERVYDVHSDEVTRSGPRLVQGAEKLAELIYPDVFAE
ncbi:ABC transporter substrate-binding protein [Halalkalibacterium halodurans]|jgi:iron complex transport system substrate-binding protein|uniref:Ferric ion ABC transporter (Ferric ion-binding protein) n=2 Tax=Halalkalibacterium halodurans TaxID=86665 RepID=Q9KCI6_HALH5|nr:ABC transporter substrate-binding protein [Halalkalibacterium halodurans]MDY7222157.1 ABC transporter substrate-binding protein [Halalkalibacterium halodurans]MDY7241378.1 ABC transporter substrate-binding protein [Halalkalibacterium halodurans]MED3646777.1 ABC transporter substrate-binding protein [Halalkalibacterium halodurans]MED4163594.1 ABC transporter substrate-binding protein [Halalkalibacterium halodurans]MED4173025.1 ABC transporter substrate-binding protein [Halalkalibacterium hal